MKNETEALINASQWKERNQQRRLDDAVMARTLSDPLLQSIVANYALMDDRGKVTLARIAQAQPKSNKEFDK